MRGPWPKIADTSHAEVEEYNVSLQDVLKYVNGYDKELMVYFNLPGPSEEEHTPDVNIHVLQGKLTGQFFVLNDFDSASMRGLMLKDLVASIKAGADANDFFTSLDSLWLKK